MLSKIYWVLEAIIVAFTFWVSDYGHHRMGLYRHLTFRYYHAKETFLLQTPVWVWILIASVIFLVSIWCILKTNKWVQFCYRFSWQGHWVAVMVLTLLLVGLINFYLNDPKFIILPYFMVGIPLLILINLIWALGIRFVHPHTEEIACKID